RAPGPRRAGAPSRPGGRASGGVSPEPALRVHVLGDGRAHGGVAGMKAHTDQERGEHLRRLVLAAMFAAIGTLVSFPPLSIPVLGTKLFPFQHTINVVAGILLGPWYAAGAALVTASLRNMLGWGAPFAF